MLAEVASATLQSNQSRVKRVTRASTKVSSLRPSRRVGQSNVLLSTQAKRNAAARSPARSTMTQAATTQADLLSLDQIRMLPDKLLLSMFAELSADEIRRNYSYTCFLVPDKCQQKYTSFGSENRARMQMKTHLLAHIAELLADSNTAAAGRTAQKTLNKFMAEPVPARRRRLAAVEVDSPRKKPRSSRQASPPKARELPECASSPPQPLVDDDGNVVEEEVVASDEAVFVDESVVDELVVWQQCDEQPLHDHCYTTLDGGKNLPDHYDEYESSDGGGGGEEHDDGQEDAEEEEEEDSDGKLAKGLYVVAEIDGLDLVSEVETETFGSKQAAEMALRQLEAIRMVQMHNKKVIVQQSSGLDGAAAAAPVVLQPLMGELLEDDDEPLDSDSEREAPDKGSPEWERRLALKCIRMLRTKKKDEHVPLVCRICKGKSFTAQATLMYHYRSHAGIKPFVCSICNTTFTRQHSLNYHMLIHNNKSRFTCADCGRKFRHPSHFKEHMRRHTGETPFECGDCGVRFKTRNTYKRHLKTRHGKLLTVNGILTLSNEEFLKVKTNPKKKPRVKKDKDTQWPDVASVLQHPGLNLKAIAISNVPLMPDIDAGESFLSPENVAAMSAFVSSKADEATKQEPEEDEEEDELSQSIDNLCKEESRAMAQQDEDNEDCFANPFAMRIDADQLAGQHIIVLEALPDDDDDAAAARSAIVEGTWTTEGVFASGETVTIALQPVL